MGGVWCPVACCLPWAACLARLRPRQGERPEGGEREVRREREGLTMNDGGLVGRERSRCMRWARNTPTPKRASPQWSTALLPGPWTARRLALYASANNRVQTMLGSKCTQCMLPALPLIGCLLQLAWCRGAACLRPKAGRVLPPPRLASCACLPSLPALLLRALLRRRSILLCNLLHPIAVPHTKNLACARVLA